MIDLEQLLSTAEARKWAAEDAARVEETPKFRGGNSGCVLEDGSTIGSCPRVSILRFLGIEEELSPGARRMFEGGYFNERYWAELFSLVPDKLKALGVARVITSDDELKGYVSWKVQDGVGNEYEVSGTPDGLMVDEAGKPVFIPELKKISSQWRADRIVTKDQVDTKHLVQNAHYSWALGKLPGCVSYSSYDSHYTYYRKALPATKIEPQRWHFYTKWVDDTFWYRAASTGEWVKTVITGQGIHEYYKTLAEMLRVKALPARPSHMHCSGEGEDFNSCKSCPFAEFCDAYETQGFEVWLERIKAEF